LEFQRFFECTTSAIGFVSLWGGCLIAESFYSFKTAQEVI